MLLIEKSGQQFPARAAARGIAPSARPPVLPSGLYGTLSRKNLAGAEKSMLVKVFPWLGMLV
jgi:hypothetical protein